MPETCTITGQGVDISGAVLPNATFRVDRLNNTTVPSGSAFSVGDTFIAVTDGSGTLGRIEGGVFVATISLVEGFNYRITPRRADDTKDLPAFRVPVPEGTGSADLTALMVLDPAPPIDQAEAAVIAAQLARDKAEQWAQNPEDDPVETGPDKFSALHWAAKAEAAASSLAPGDFGAPLIATDTAAEARTLLNVAAIVDVGLGGQTADIDPDAAGLVTRFVRFTGANAPGGVGSWHGIHISRVLNEQSAQIAVRDTSDSNPPQMAFRHRHSTGDWADWAFARTTAELIEAAGLGLSGPGLFGRSASGAGAAERIEVGAGLDLDAGVLSADPQGWEHIVTVPISASVTHVDITDLAGWTDLMVHTVEVTGSSSSTARDLRVSSDNGSSYIDAAIYGTMNTGGNRNSARLSDTGAGARSMTLIIHGFGLDWASKPMLGGRTTDDVPGGIHSSAVFDAIRVLASVGNLTGGSIMVFGRK